jgi:acetylornithine deacetylase/succinyl-diaminopimelate desuccinylase-like protein
MPSGAGHDAMKLGEVMPQAMLFVRGENAGISHNPLESSTADDMQLAVEAFLQLLDGLGRGERAAMSDADFARLDAWVDANFDDEVRFLQALVRVPTDTPPGDNAPHAEATAALLEGFGFAVERHPVPDAIVREHGLASITNLVVRRRYGDGPTIALNAHGDVVPPGEGWHHDPYGGEVEDGRLYGRAAAVSKSDFATYTFAVRALESLGARLAGGVELHFTYDEEFGGELGPGGCSRKASSSPTC